jgi:hypothetical protein
MILGYSLFQIHAVDISATNTTDIAELQINNDESTHRPSGRVSTMIT